jgi:hypothetical protein
MLFAEVHPSLDNYWRAVILFGRNVASYKFALGKAAPVLADLALPFSRAIAKHLEVADKQVDNSLMR